MYLRGVPHRKMFFFLYVNGCKEHTVIFKNGSVIHIHAIFITSESLLVIERVLFKDSAKF